MDMETWEMVADYEAELSKIKRLYESSTRFWSELAESYREDVKNLRSVVDALGIQLDEYEVLYGPNE